MICGYENIDTLCLSNKYQYQYLQTVSVNGIAVNRSDIDAPVLRTDSDTGETLVLYSTSSDQILPCDTYDEAEIVSAWECYQKWLSAGNIPEDAPLLSFKETQKNIIASSYNDALQRGYSTTINDVNINLPRDEQYQLNLTSTMLKATIDYTVNNKDTIPTIIDSEGNTIEIPYTSLLDEYEKYNTEISRLNNLKNQLFNEVNNAIDKQSITNNIWDTTKLIDQDGCGAGYGVAADGKCTSYE
jgi:hypothetical protein